jgi:cytosine deaminase
VLIDAICRARVARAGGLVDLELSDGRVAAIVPSRGEPPAAQTRRAVLDAAGRAVIAGLVDAHVHLDKALQLDALAAAGRPLGTLAEAIAATAEVRARLDPAMLRRRAELLLERMVRHGTTAARVHVELDAEAGLAPVTWQLELADAWRDRIGLQLVAFPQHGLLYDHRMPRLLDDALAAGCGVVGACAYADDDQLRHIDHVFAVAARNGQPLDLHLDFTDDPDVHLVDAVLERTLAHGLQGRVAVGHVTSLAAMAPADVAARAAALAEADVGVIALPATDVFLGGRAFDRARPRGLAPIAALAATGVTVAVATNNVQNAFTPYGDGSLLAVAWLAGLVAQMPPGSGHDALLEMVTTAPARILQLERHGPLVGARADLAVLDCEDPRAAVVRPAAVEATICGGRVSWCGPGLRGPA